MGGQENERSGLPAELDEIVNRRRCPYKHSCSSGIGDGLCIGEYELCSEYRDRFDKDVAIYFLHGGLVKRQEN
jgi:hypothetical protein